MTTQCTDDDGGAIIAGQAVCLSGWDGVRNQPKVKRASRVNLVALKTVYGVCKSVGAAPNDFTDNARRDPLAGTPWHKYVPARLEPA